MTKGRGLEWEDVRAILDELGIVRYEVGPLGFTVHAPFMHGIRNPDDSWRLRCGSGIAGRGGWWTLVQVTTGDVLSVPPIAVGTRSELRRILREQLATEQYGPRPPERPGYIHYAAFHHTRFTSGYVWLSRRVKGA